MRGFKNIIGAFVFLGILAASTVIYCNSNGNQLYTFSQSWELVNYDSKGQWEMVYGYNTEWINEDYTHTRHYYKSHTAIVQNDNGVHWNTAVADKWAKVETAHKGRDIKHVIAL